MPIMDGFEATVKIRDMMESPPPIIALTAYNTEETKQRCFQAGMQGFLTKPLEMAKFKELLYQLGISLDS